jgi:hemerythrin superfamily protein
MSTDVVELLTAQHKAVDELFESIEAKQGNRQELVQNLADLLAAHATVEEKIFYPAVMAKQTKAMLHESVEEHLGMKRILADLTTKQLDDESFAAKISVLKENVSHHAHKEEEKKLFPLVKEAFDADQRAAIGNEVLAMFVELIDANPAKNLPAETAKAAPLPKL